MKNLTNLTKNSGPITLQDGKATKVVKVSFQEKRFMTTEDTTKFPGFLLFLSKPINGFQ